MKSFKMATLKINGVSSPTKLRMLADLLSRQDVDVSLLQEVTTPDLAKYRDYNVDTTMWGTAIIVRSILQLTKTTALRQDEQWQHTWED
jgi:exonuclease III